MNGGAGANEKEDHNLVSPGDADTRGAPTISNTIKEIIDYASTKL